MSLTVMVFLAAISVLTTMITLLRVFSWRSLMKFHWGIDVLFTIGLLYLFSGSLTGTVIAVVSGLILSITLTIGKAFTPTPRIIDGNNEQ